MYGASCNDRTKVVARTLEDALCMYILSLLPLPHKTGDDGGTYQSHCTYCIKLP